MNLKNRLNTHFAACAAVAAATVAVAPQQADAALVYSGPVSINIPDNIDGVYLNVVTGASGAAAPAGWDINPYSAVAGGFYLWGATANTFYNPQGVIGGNYNLAVGTTISGAAAAFFRPGGATDLTSQFNLNSSDNYIGFRFTNEAMGGMVQFGWAQLSFGATGGQRSIVAYAYEDSGAAIQAGVVPAPGAIALLGLAGLVGSRRRRVA